MTCKHHHAPGVSLRVTLAAATLARRAMGRNAPYGARLVRNITSHPTAGIGAWSDDEIKRALTHAVAHDGCPFKPPMDRAAYSSKLTPEDLDALVVYLRTSPPLE